MQQKNLQSLRHKVAAQPADGQDAELLTPELAAQLKSGSAFPTESLLTAEPTGLWRLVSPWLHRLERAMTPAGRIGQAAASPRDRPSYD